MRNVVIGNGHDSSAFTRHALDACEYLDNTGALAKFQSKFITVLNRRVIELLARAAVARSLPVALQ